MTSILKPSSAPNSADGMEAPVGWKPNRLRHVLTVNPAPPRQVRTSTDDVSFLPMELIGEDGSLDLSRVRPVQDVLTGYSYFADGDVIFAKVTPCFENGKAAVIRGLPTGYGFGTTEVTTLRPGPDIDQGFLGYLIRTDGFRQPGIAAMTGAGGLKRVPDDYVRDFSVALPPATEQKAIVAFLDRETARIDALIAKHEQLIATLREDRTATVAEAFEGPEPVRLRRLVDPERPMTYGILQCGEPVEDGVPYIGPSDMPGQGQSPPLATLRRTTNEIAASYRRSVLSGGDVVVSIGPAYGRVAVVGPDLTGANLTQDTVRVAALPSLVDTRYLVWVLLSRQTAQFWDMEITGATFRRLNLGTLALTPVPLPALDEQRRIAVYLDAVTTKVDALISKATEVIETLREYRSALITDAVTGKIDVRGAA